MGRVILGVLIAAVVMFVVGAIFFATPLVGLGQGNLPDVQAAEVQRTLAANMPATGTYVVPNPTTEAQTVMYGQGPVATVHYNVGGFPSLDAGSLLVGFLLYLLTAIVIAGALWAIERQVHDFESRARVVVGLVVIASAYIHLKMPIFYHQDWSHAVYMFIADAVTLGAGGLVIAKWFLPRHRHSPADAPTAV